MKLILFIFYLPVLYCLIIQGYSYSGSFNNNHIDSSMNKCIAQKDAVSVTNSYSFKHPNPPENKNEKIGFNVEYLVAATQNVYKQTISAQRIALNVIEKNCKQPIASYNQSSCIISFSQTESVVLRI